MTSEIKHRHLFVTIDDHYDGRPVLGHRDRKEYGTTVRYFYHLTPSGGTRMLGRMVNIGNYTVVYYKCMGQDDRGLLWECYGQTTEQQAMAMVKEQNVEYIHAEGKQ